MLSLSLAALALLLSLGTPQSSSAELELPESLAARAWAGVGPETRPVDLEAELFQGEPWLLDPVRADPALVWERWGAWLAAEGSGDAIDARRRAGLAVLAVHQGRWEDAWAHFERLGAAPEWALAVAPLFVPGVPVEHLATANDPTRALPDGILLRPAVPPRPADDPPTSLRPRECLVRGLRIGQAVLDLRVSIEPSGLEVDLWHLSGEACQVSVVLPEPPGQEIRVEYVDWMRQEALREPLVLRIAPAELVPGEPAPARVEHNLFGRFRPRRQPTPTLPRAGLPRSLTLGGLWFVTPDDPELLRSAGPVARAVGRLFGFPSATLTPELGEAPTTWNGTRVHLAPGPAGRAKLISLVSQCERYVLSGGLRR